jgi:anti-repressor protein
MQNNKLFGENPNEKGLQSFNFNDSPIRTLINEQGKIYFVASDVCKVLAINNVSDALSRLDEDEKNTIVLNEGNKGNPNKTIINESGLYSLVLSSRKPEAKAFKKWVTSEVLPQIRKTGAYVSKSLSTSEMFAMQVQINLENEKRLSKLEAKVETIDTDFYTLAGYYKLKGKKWDLVDNGIKAGKELTELSKVRGYVVRDVHSEKFGCVNVYHINVLNEYFSVVNKLGKQNGLF